jgi:hypothetical protein
MSRDQFETEMDRKWGVNQIFSGGHLQIFNRETQVNIAPPEKHTRHKIATRN